MIYLCILYAYWKSIASSEKLEKICYDNVFEKGPFHANREIVFFLFKCFLPSSSSIKAKAQLCKVFCFYLVFCKKRNSKIANVAKRVLNIKFRIRDNININRFHNVQTELEQKIRNHHFIIEFRNLFLFNYSIIIGLGL